MLVNTMPKNFIGRRVQGTHASIVEPCYNDGEEIVRNLKMNRMYKFTVKESRNPEFNGMAFSFLNKVFEYQSSYLDREQMRKQLSIDAGHFDHYYVQGDKICVVPRSWSFDEMDDLEFRPLIAKIVEAAIERFDIPRDADWIPNVFVEDFEP